MLGVKFCITGKAKAKATAPETLKRKGGDHEAPQGKKLAVEAANNKPQAKKQPEPQHQKSKGDNKQQQQQKPQEQKKPQEQPKAEKKPQEQQPKAEKKTLSNGLVIEDTKVGQGKTAKKGNTVLMRYTGRLASNNRVFDSNKSGAPFKFRLGASQVIKGWDLGIEGNNPFLLCLNILSFRAQKQISLAGMAVGGERTLVIPPGLAYGASGAPPEIPKNAQLVFDVKLIEIK